jgi:ribosomal protein S16
VLDEPSGQVVTLHEALKRDRYRCALMGKLEPLKRKADEIKIENDRAHKRTAQADEFLNNLG